MYKYILIDLDDTVLDFKKAESYSISLILESYNISPTENLLKQFSDINESCWMEFEKGIVKERIIFQEKRFEIFFKELNIEIDPSIINKTFLKNITETYFLVDNVVKTLSYLKDKYDLYIVSNGVKKIQVNRLTKANLINYFKDIFVSDEIGYTKPDIRFFEYVINQVGDTNLENYFLVGDREKTDIKGALNINIDSCLLNHRNIETKANYSINNLIELLNIL